MEIRPITDLQNNYSDISNSIKKSSHPIVLTKNGNADMVLMSWEQFQEREQKNEIHKKILASEAEYQKNQKSYSLDEVFGKMLDIVQE